MIYKFTDLPDGACFLGKDGTIKKKVAERKALVVKDNGKVNTRKVKGNPDCEQTICPLRYLGVGLRKHPDMMVEIGDGNILERRKNRY